MQRKLSLALALLLLLPGCLPAQEAPTQTTTPTAIIVPTASPGAAQTPTETFAPTPTTPPVETPTAGLPEEEILILEPGPGSRLADSIHLAGVAGPTFESHLLIQVVLDDGSEVVILPLIIQAEMGNRGPFTVDIPFSVEEPRQAFILVSSSSPRDGGLTHLASVGVTLVKEGAAEIRPASEHTEKIVITRPALGETLSSGLVHVEGVAQASFEGTLIVELLDMEGNMLASQPVIVQAAEMGQYGRFALDLPFQVTAPGPGRVVVRDPSVVFSGDVHLASVEVSLAP